jgi:6-phosphogluconolactonase
MRIRSLGSLAKALSIPALSLLLASCGSNNTNNQFGECSGCFLVTATTNASQILTFQVNSSGVLSTPAITQGAADSPYLTAPLTGNAVYVSDPNSNAIDAFAVNSSDDTLSAIPGSPFSLGPGPGRPAGLLTFGNYLYVGDTNGTIAALSNNTPTGALTTLPGSPYAAGFAPVNLIWATNNSDSTNLLYAADFTGGGIWGFIVNNSDGSLTSVPGSPFATAPNSAPAAMAVTGSGITGGILYVTLSGLNEIAAFSIADSGALTPLPGSPFSTGRGPASLLADNDYLYTLNGLDHTVSAYSVDQNTGILTQVQGSPFPAGTASGGLINGTPGVLYAPDSQSNSILAFSVDLTTGSLSPLSGSPFPTAVGPVALTTIRFPILTPP